MTFLVWHCPVCHWVVSDVEREQSRFDYECCGCGVRTLSEYEIGAGPVVAVTDEMDPADWWKC